MSSANQWSDYYNATLGRAARDQTKNAIKYILDSLPLVSIDIGFGAGNEALYLLKNGWDVTAIDQEKKAGQILRERAGRTDQLQIQIGSFEKASFHSCSLLHAGFSLPFTLPRYFETVWMRIINSISKGGIFVDNYLVQMTLGVIMKK